VAEGEVGGVGHALEEILERVTGGCAVEGEPAAGVLLREVVVLLPPQVAAEGDVVILMVPVDRGRRRGGLVAIVQRQAIVERGEAVGESERRRTPGCR